ncbi:capsule assembly Wzi family protein [Algoriphagus machipongonensis]|uniref:capsule assembly Wzi family protein n=1 Tax=Algoriphagus machipongonensis TaxID=388413 RepID=UPI0012930D7D|nr:capsule assembly Wzi family protein [Algoriphagus machipongonensis]
MTALLFQVSFVVFSQILNSDIPVLEQFLRREQLLGSFDPSYSFQLRPFRLDGRDSSITSQTISNYLIGKSMPKNPKVRFNLLPIISTTEINTKRPYGWGNKGLVPNVGVQTYFSTGFYARFHFLEIQFQPEMTYSQNKAFEGFSNDFSGKVLSARFFYWNNGDNPERFGKDPISRLWWGQSSINILAGPIQFGISTENIWWGPGQFNSLTFSDNAEGFPHLSLKSRRPLKTFMGNFESEVIIGRLENSGLFPSQDAFLNQRYFRKFDGDWRYLNALHITYNPSFLPNLFLGFNRTFQQYNKYREKTFNDYFPIFEVFQKKTLFENGNSVVYDGKGQDQQVSLSIRYLVPKANVEVYAELGRRDHAYDWRDFILNPEHARAYLFGLQKLFPLPEQDTYIQVRAEMTHQQESINRYNRYPGLIGNQTWHTHGLARGFVNEGEALGVGVGVGSNVQTIEISKVSKMNKRGILLERLANNQDFFYRAFGQNPEKKPWVDLSLGFLWDEQFGRLILSGKAQFIKGFNYQWQSDNLSTSDYPNGKNNFSFFGNFSLIYQLQK